MSDYQEAIQNPRICFADPELQSGVPKTNVIGLPQPITGNFASVYQLKCRHKTYAVRCFLRNHPDLEQRYAAIGQHLKRNRLPYMVDFDLIKQGILVRGQWYPILRMEWLNGISLHRYVESQLGQPHVLHQLALHFQRMLNDLRRANIAHGDLQHGNILIVNGQLRLIDYDGMYVPTLAGMVSHESGHRNYQHPRRSERDFGPHIDNYSAWVIYLSLLALSYQPGLWKQLEAGDESLLFREEDLKHMQRSTAIRALEAVPDGQVQSMLNTFRTLSQKSVAEVPALDGRVERNIPQVISSAVASVADGVGWLSDMLNPRKETTKPPADVPPPPTVSSSRTPTRPLVTSPGLSWLQDHLQQTRPVATAPPHPVSNAPTQAIASSSGNQPNIAVVDDIGRKLLIGYAFLMVMAFSSLIGGLPWLAVLGVMGFGTTVTFGYLGTQYLALTEVQEKIAISRQLRELKREFNQAQQRFNDSRQALNRLKHDEQERIHYLKTMAREDYIQQELAAHQLEDAHIARVGRGTLSRLLNAGIMTAADVAWDQVVAVDGVGDKRARLLLDWRDTVERQVRQQINRTFPAMQSREIAAIQSEYQAKRTPYLKQLAQDDKRIQQLPPRIQRREQRLATYQDVNFRAYLRSVLFPHNASP
jgi:serine/threonine protein kinase